MLSFVTEESYIAHTEYLNTLRSLCSANEKMTHGLSGIEAEALLTSKRLIRRYPKEITVLAECRLHELYFSSFSARTYPNSSLSRKFFGSEAALLTELYRLAGSLPYGFVGVSLKSSIPRLFATGYYPDVFLDGVPILALDVCEHAYFRDWGYNRAQYLKEALKHLAINRLDSFL